MVVKVSQVAKAFHDEMLAEGKDIATFQEIDEYAQAHGLVEKKDLQFVRLYGTGRGRHWWKTDGEQGLLRLNAPPAPTVKSETPTPESTPPAPAEEVPLIGVEEIVRRIAVQLGVNEKVAASSAAFLTRNYNMDSPSAIWAGLVQISELTLSQKRRLFLTLTNAFGLSVDRSMLDRVESHPEPGAQATPVLAAPSKKYLVLAGEITPLDDPYDPAGLSWGQAVQLAQLQIDRMRSAQAPQQSPNPWATLDAMLPGLSGLLGHRLQAILDPQPSSTIPTMVGGVTVGLDVDSYLKLREAEGKTALIKWVRDVAPEFLDLGKAFAASIQPSAASASPETTLQCAGCGVALAFQREAGHTGAACPKCGAVTELKAKAGSGKAPRKKPVPTPPAPTAAQETTVEEPTASAVEQAASTNGVTAPAAVKP